MIVDFKFFFTQLEAKFRVERFIKHRFQGFVE